MTTQPSRAEWWREVTDPDEILEKGRWFRVENDDYAAEHRCSHDTPRSDWYEDYRFFVDSRQQPPLKVGDTVTSVEQLDSLPFKAIVKAGDNQAWQAESSGSGIFWYATLLNMCRNSKLLLEYSAPLTLLWLPEGAEQ